MTNWTCSACGFANSGSSCRECGGSPPDYGRHLRDLNLSAGPVFNGPVQVNVDSGDTEAVLTKWFGDPEEETIQETIRNKPTSWDQIVNGLIKVVFWFSTCVAVLAIGTILLILVKTVLHFM